MTSARITLESFEDEPEHGEPDSEDYLRGLADGIQIGEQSQIAALAQATEAVSATLSDLTFGFAEARVQLMGQLQPLLAQVSDTVVPHILHQTFKQHLIEVLVTDFDDALNRPVHVKASPDMVTHLATELSGHSSQFVFSADPLLEGGQAILTDPDTQVMIDLPALILDLQTALSGLDPLERTQIHG